MMFPLHYEDVSRKDPLLKPNHANVMEVPGSCEIRLVPVSDLRILFGKLAMEMSFQKTGSFQARNGSVSYFARRHGMSLVRISTVMSIFYSPVEIRENPILFSMETEFCEFSPSLSDHLEIFERFNVTIVTSANTKDETLPPWSGFLLKDEGK